jgi:antitoxin component YwqK of YwqJK toxin-antitoxin module
MANKNLILFCFFIITLTTYSCQKETCKGVVFKNGISSKGGILYSGTCITHHTNGEVRSIQNYKNGYDHGEWKFFYRDKKIQVKGTFNLGQKDGKWVYYYENSILHKEHFYENGKKIGVWKTYDENGKISSETRIN